MTHTNNNERHASDSVAAFWSNLNTLNTRLSESSYGGATHPGWMEGYSEGGKIGKYDKYFGMAGLTTPTQLINNATDGLRRHYDAIGNQGFGTWATQQAFGMLKTNHDLEHWEDYGNKYDQLLEQRGFMDFYFPAKRVSVDSEDNESLSTRPIICKIPFFENPKIKESRKANYASTKIMNRNEPVRLWTGAQAREVKLTFNMTMPHILEFYKHVEQLDNFVAASKASYLQFKLFTEYIKGEADKHIEKFAEAASATNVIPKENPEGFDWKDPLGEVMSIAKEKLDFNTHAASLQGALNKDLGFGINVGKMLGVPNPGEHIFLKAQQLVGLREGKPWDEQHDEKKVLASIAWMVNVIRASVIGSNPGRGSHIDGPPILTLKFGSMYDNHPFIVKQYSIDVVDKAGYDTKTLTPRIIKVSLSLEEYRQSFGTGASSPSVLFADRSNLNGKTHPFGWEDALGFVAAFFASPQTWKEKGHIGDTTPAANPGKGVGL